MLGAVHERVAVYGSGGFTSYDDRQLTDQLGGWVKEQGIPRVKIKIGESWGGAVERDFYLSVKSELLERLRGALPLDGVFLDIHGAMTVVGLTDAEGDLATAVRVCRVDCLFSVVGHVSRG